MLPIQRRYIALFAGEGWTPLVERQGDDVFASLWQGNDLRLWTLVNRAEKPYAGKLLTVSHTRGTIYFDLIKGTEAQVEIKGEIACLNGSIDARGIGGFIAIPEKAITRDFDQFLQKQAEIFSRRDGDTDYPQGKEFVTAITRTSKYDRSNIPQGMTAIDAARVKLEVDLSDDGSPSGFYWKTPTERDVKLSAYAIDLTPVTNKQFAQFLKNSGYKPRHEKNFLKHWVNGKVPAGKEDHPVVYVDLEDARAYAKWAGKRLPTEDEWQYVAQGPKRLKYPWGNKMKSNACNNGQTNGTTSVYAFPDGRSPFGCYDMCGNTWEWTDSERSNEGRTRFCYVRGGSFYNIEGSHWYADGGALPCGLTTKFLLVWPGLDRCSTIGFRCVVDLAPIK
jgi:formylglycine-generating enzyme required for sulfatase activity